MSAKNKSISLSRQSTPKRKDISYSKAELASDLHFERKYSEKLENRINQIEKSTHCGISRSITPISTKLLEPRLNIDLNHVCKGSVSIFSHKVPEKATTERKTSNSLRVTPSSYRITPPLEDDLSFNQRNIENLRNELNRKREMIVGSSQSRKELENKYWTIQHELEETANRLEEVKRKNSQIRNDILVIQSNY